LGDAVAQGVEADKLVRFSFHGFSASRWAFGRRSRPRCRSGQTGSLRNSLVLRVTLSLWATQSPRVSKRTKWFASELIGSPRHAEPLGDAVAQSVEADKVVRFGFRGFSASRWAFGRRSRPKVSKRTNWFASALTSSPRNAEPLGDAVAQGVEADKLVRFGSH